MWNLERQERFRRLWLAGILLAMAGGVLFVTRFYPELLSHAGIKTAELRLSFAIESYAFFLFPLLWVIGFAGSLFGMPSLVTLGIFTLLWGPLIAGLSIFSIHLVAFGWIIRKKAGGESISPLSGVAKEIAGSPGLSASQVAFWPRLFLNLPPRTLDALLAWKRAPGESLFAFLPGYLGGIFIRNTLQLLWLFAGFNFLRDFRPFPENDLLSFFFWSAVLFVLSIWTRVPELIPGVESLSLLCRAFHQEELEFLPAPPVISGKETLSNEQKGKETENTSESQPKKERNPINTPGKSTRNLEIPNPKPA
ncbi:MAG: hypothetical protein WA705_31865 [Candidatus Ozemobacteraceae bacterium]